MTARGTLAVLLVPLALLATACGDGSGSAAADPTTPESSSSSTSDPSTSTSTSEPLEQPQCSDVWVEGKKLPGGYHECYEGANRVKANGRYCEFGKPLITYREHWYATPGGPVNRTTRKLADDPDYQQAIKVCGG